MGWVERSVISGPPRGDYVGAYLASLGRFVVFGETSGATWTFDGATWTDVTPATSPPPRRGAAMAYASNMGDVVLYGGNGFDDTWAFDGSRWTNLSPSLSPPARSDAAMAFLPSRNELVLFGGQGAGGYFDETWRFDGSSWAKLPLVTSPSGRVAATMSYDPSLGKVVLFGGAGTNPVWKSDTWTYDGSWSPVATPTKPDGRANVSMAYDPRLARTVLFGGNVGSYSFDDTWVFDGSTWTDVSPPMSPPGRYGQAMAFHGRANALVLLDGEASPSDTWVLGRLPGAPTIGAVSSGDKEATVRWTAPASNGGVPITGYVVTPFVNGVEQPSRSLGAGTTQKVTGLVNGVTYQFRVAAANVVGTGAPSALSRAVTVGADDSSRNSIYRLYRAYFLREPEPAGLAYWIGQHDRGKTLAVISEQFARSSEFRRRYGQLDNGQFVDLIFRNLFNRSADAAGRTYWVGVLNRGRTRGAVMIGFSESNEFKRITGTT